MLSDPIGFVGLGVMGAAMSSHLLRAGVPVVGFDLSADRAALHREAGGEVVASPAEVARRCELVVTSLPSAAALHSVLTGPDGVLSADGQVVVLETSTLDLADKLSAFADVEAAGSALLDCPMSGTGQQARNGDLVAYLSGAAAAKVSAGRALVHITRAVHDVGDFGNGTRMKLVANLLVAVHNLAAAEALLLAEQAGLDLDRVLTAVGDGAGTSRMFEIRGPLMAARSFDQATMKVSTFQKDLDVITRFAASLGVPVPLLATTAGYYQAAADGGRGEQDTASVIEILRQQLGAAQVD